MNLDRQTYYISHPKSQSQAEEKKFNFLIIGSDIKIYKNIEYKDIINKERFINYAHIHFFLYNSQ